MKIRIRSTHALERSLPPLYDNEYTFDLPEGATPFSFSFSYDSQRGRHLWYWMPIAEEDA